MIELIRTVQGVESRVSVKEEEAERLLLDPRFRKADEAPKAKKAKKTGFQFNPGEGLEEE